MPADNGPYETARQAHAAAVAAVPPAPGWSILRHDENLRLLHDALQDAGVTTAAYEEKLADWLANYEDETIAVIAGWIRRAAQTPEGTATEWGVRFGGAGDRHVEPHIDEDVSWAIANQVRAQSPGMPARVVSRQVTAWTEAAEPEEDEDHE
jgi:hypothetical protein